MEWGSREGYDKPHSHSRPIPFATLTIQADSRPRLMSEGKNTQETDRSISWNTPISEKAVAKMVIPFIRLSTHARTGHCDHMNSREPVAPS